MNELGAEGKVKRVQIEATVIRANGEREQLGVVSDSAKRWRFGPGRLRAWWRTRRANKKART
jgi:hypothetical protein